MCACVPGVVFYCVVVVGLMMQLMEIDRKSPSSAMSDTLGLLADGAQVCVGSRAGCLRPVKG